MKEKTLKSWEDFEQASLRIISEKREQKEKTEVHVDHPLFRGQSDSGWRLESALDRIQKEMSVDHYNTIVKIVHKHVATCTGRGWDLDTKVSLGEFNLPAYEFMAYLRHNEFPSPLLDWSRSPYIAAYFAFSDIYLTSKDIKYVSIFVCPEHFWYGKEPHIRSLGPTIATHRNHYLQQSEYTICIKKKGKEIYYDDYEAVKNKEEQDVMIKYNIPVSEQSKVLRKLDSMNITAYSLFDSESSLMETLAMRDICFEKWDRLSAYKNE
ncbi:MAG: FRG domain-containing protein [Planctomycetes bacterium]|nr:FRG domain-containing protein [Planctomycetota bacterium]